MKGFAASSENGQESFAFVEAAVVESLGLHVALPERTEIGRDDVNLPLLLGSCIALDVKDQLCIGHGAYSGAEV